MRPFSSSLRANSKLIAAFCEVGVSDTALRSELRTFPSGSPNFCCNSDKARQLAAEAPAACSISC